MKGLLSALIILLMIASIGLFNEGKRQTRIAIILLIADLILIIILEKL